MPDWIVTRTIQTAIIADSAKEAYDKEANGEGTVSDLTVRASARPQPLARNPAIAAMQQAGQVVNMKTGQPVGGA